MKAILEALGVPDGLNTVAKNIITELRSSIGNSEIPTLSMSEFLDGVEGLIIEKEIIDRKFNINIGDIKLSDIPFTVVLRVTNKHIGKPKLIRGMYGRNTEVSFGDDNQAYLMNDMDTSKLRFIISVNFIDLTTDGVRMADIADVLDNMALKILSHELMHLYDAFKRQKTRLYKKGQYETYMNRNYSMGVLADLLFLLYYTTQIENAVRPVELYQDIINGNISKSNFRAFMQDSDIIKNLTKAERFTVSKFREDIENDSLARDFMETLYVSGKMRRGESYADDAITFLYNHNIDNLESYLKRNIDDYTEPLEELKEMLNKVNMATEMIDMDIRNAKGYLAEINQKIRKSANSPEKFINNIQRILNSNGSKMKRKLYKLYDLVK
jgi:hypothetical protein